MNFWAHVKEEDYENDSDYMRTDQFKESQAHCDAWDGYLAREMWKGYQEWLSNRPGELENFKEFMVS